ncbi:hypothetical protein OKW21_002650 [Catalinimonas alkaloidigena]|uniref:hypothetical protein n=1 Tax=Catalinimonas alkaloidigena TaxID=1075417 RepID=UPI0024049EF5|nr:hypothetical protein [Catalinimonas alkaloidigena]MDF9797387.1 hypothetical protein [Catalinimonas alkaloidigena]
MSATKTFSDRQQVFQQPTASAQGHRNQTKEEYDLLTLVNQSYQALDIGQLGSIDDLRRALEDVESVRKSFMENNFPSDTESLGLASVINSSEELETFERMVSFYEKRKPPQGIRWELFTIKNGKLCLKSNQEREYASLENKRREAVEQLIRAIQQVEALGITPFNNFDSPIITKQGDTYILKR